MWGIVIVASGGWGVEGVGSRGAGGAAASASGMSVDGGGGGGGGWEACGLFMRAQTESMSAVAAEAMGRACFLAS